MDVKMLQPQRFYQPDFQSFASHYGFGIDDPIPFNPELSEGLLNDATGLKCKTAGVLAYPM